MPSTPGRTRPTDLAAAERITERLASKIGARKYDMWFGHTRMRVEGERLDVATDSQFVANWIDTHFSGELHGAAREALGQDMTIDVHVAPEVFGREVQPPDPHTPRPHARPPARPRPGDRSRRPLIFRKLEDFVVGASNKLAHAAACRLVDDPEADSISPLFVHGDCGVGKTHLLQGICGRFRGRCGRNANVRYVTGEQFTNEYIAAIRNSNLDEFRQRTRRLDLLVIDDVHFLANKVRTQSEFLHTIDAIDLGGARLVLASDNHPRHIKRFSQALVSRFLSGMVVKVDRPDRETRLKLIRRLAEARGLPMNDAAIDAIAARCVGSVRELEGAITKLAALSTLPGNNGHGGEIGHVLTEQLFNDHGWQPATPVRMTTVIEGVCQRLGISQTDLMGSGRHRRVVLGRALVAFLGRQLTTQSYPEIAQSIGRTYHSTVHTAAQRLRRQLEAGERVELGGADAQIDLQELVDELRHDILRATAGRT